MNLKQCPGCQGMVDAAKSYCPDCGAPMEEELKRSGSSEFDSMMQTQNISRTTQFRLMEDFNLSGVFKLPKETGESEAINPPPNVRPETPSSSRKPETVALKPAGEAAPVKSPEAVSSSNKKLYIAVGAGLVLFGLVLFALIIAGALFFNYSK